MDYYLDLIFKKTKKNFLKKDKNYYKLFDLIQKKRKPQFSSKNYLKSGKTNAIG